MANKQGVLIKVMIVIIVILAIVILYALLIRPGITGFAVDRQNEGIEVAIVSIMQRAATCETVPLTYGNQTINLIAIECLQQQPVAQ